MKKGTAVGIILTVFFCVGILVTIPALSKQTNILNFQVKCNDDNEFLIVV